MMSTIDELTPNQAAELRRHAAERQCAIEAAFLRRPWRDAAAAYFRAQREAGRLEMTQLLEATGVQAPVPAVAIAPLLTLAVHLFLGVEPGDARLTASEPDACSLTLEVSDCPIYHRLLGEPSGQTACSCFSRRAGWYRALGRQLEDDPEGNLKWGDPACRVTIRLI